MKLIDKIIYIIFGVLWLITCSCSKKIDYTHGNFNEGYRVFSISEKKDLYCIFLQNNNTNGDTLIRVVSMKNLTYGSFCRIKSSRAPVVTSVSSVQAA